jgi:hypothetical protein
MRQMMRQQQQQNEQAQHFGPIDSPELTKMIRDIVRDILNEEVKKAIPTRQNIPIF